MSALPFCWHCFWRRRRRRRWSGAGAAAAAAAAAAAVAVPLPVGDHSMIGVMRTYVESVLTLGVVGFSW